MSLKINSPKTVKNIFFMGNRGILKKCPSLFDNGQLLQGLLCKAITVKKKQDYLTKVKSFLGRDAWQLTRLHYFLHLIP